MEKMRVVQVTQVGGRFELVERDIANPGPGQVRIKVKVAVVSSLFNAAVFLDYDIHPQFIQKCAGARKVLDLLERLV